MRLPTTLLIASFLCLMPVAANADLASHNQDFEGLTQADPNALGAAGWLVFGNIFDPSFNYITGYGPFPAPNAPGAFCNIANGQGGPAQGNQQLVVVSDYNNVGHGVGNWIESNVFQEQTIGAPDVGSTWVFRFDAKLGDLVGPTTAVAFIKTLAPPTYGLTNFITIDMTAIPATWGTYMMSIDIVPALEGQILQFGFANTTTNYTPSGVFYDNINFARQTPTRTQNTSWGRLKKLYR
jgi:hypothetical protein